MTDTNDLLRETAANIRAVAAEAANDSDGDVLCCWDFERIGGHERVIAVRTYRDGTDSEIVALPAVSGVAGHVATWDPPAAAAVARLLEACADPRERVPARVHTAAVEVAKVLGSGRAHEDVRS